MSTIFDKKGITVTSSFDLQSRLPLDSRFIVSTSSELNQMTGDGNCSYLGMEVWVIDEAVKKRLIQNAEGEQEWITLSNISSEDLDETLADLQDGSYLSDKVSLRKHHIVLTNPNSSTIIYKIQFDFLTFAVKNFTSLSSLTSYLGTYNSYFTVTPTGYIKDEGVIAIPQFFIKTDYTMDYFAYSIADSSLNIETRTLDLSGAVLSDYIEVEQPAESVENTICSDTLLCGEGTIIRDITYLNASICGENTFCGENLLVKEAS